MSFSPAQDPLEARPAAQGDAPHPEGGALDEEALEQGAEASDDLLCEVSRHRIQHVIDSDLLVSGSWFLALTLVSPHAFV
jgi:hypothetical protein